MVASPPLARAFALSLLVASSPYAQEARPIEPVLSVQGHDFHSWAEYTGSPLFRALGLRCATAFDPGLAQRMPPSDCSLNNTNVSPVYAPGPLMEIPVVVHVLQSTTGNGQISNALIQSQIDVLNEDFRALPGSLGAPGVDSGIRFHLATVDPAGNPTTGVTRTTNDLWYNDLGNYWSTLAWDTNRYLNVYTNTASGALGYVSAFPASGSAGSPSDRVVILWSAFGRNAPIGPPYDLGRTATHEVGHYLGLYHTFQGGCSGASCYTAGDLICDTNAESNPNYGCPGSRTSCGSTDPIDNYMDYSDDVCMDGFTDEQVNRMRCTLANWRPALASTACAPGTVAHRNAGPNLDVLTGYPTGPGLPLRLVVDDGGATGYDTISFLGFTRPDQVTVSNGYVRLVDTFSRRILFASRPNASPTEYTLQVPNNPNFCGLTLYVQVMFSGGQPGFALTNAQDLTLGS